MKLDAQTLRLLNWRILPVLFFGQVLLYVDRINVGFAALEMNKELGFTAEIFGFGAGIFFIGYALFEVPSNLILYKVGAPRWLGRIMVTWGLAAMGMAFVSGPISFYVLRFLLGVAEAGYGPGLFLFLSAWYPRGYRAAAVGTVLSATPFAGVIAAPVSTALLGLEGLGLSGWQWMYIIEGLPALLFGLAFPWLLARGPSKAAWLPEQSRAAIEDSLAAEKAENALAERSRFAACLMSAPVWLYTLAYFGFLAGIYSLYFWLPQVVKLAFPQASNLQIGILSAIPFLIGGLCLVGSGVTSDRSGDRRWHLVGMGAVAGVGLILATQLPPLLGFISLCVAVGVGFSYMAVFWPSPMAALSGTAAAGGLAFINAVGNLGGFLGPYLFGVIRGYTGSFDTGIAVFSTFFFLAGLIPLICPSLFSSRQGGATMAEPAPLRMTK